MVQVINLERRPQGPSQWDYIGSQLGQGLSSGIQAGINQKITEALQQKEQDKQKAAVGKAAMAFSKMDGMEDMAPLYASIGELGGVQAMQKLYESPRANKLRFLEQAHDIVQQQSQTPLADQVSGKLPSPQQTGAPSIIPGQEQQPILGITSPQYNQDFYAGRTGTPTQMGANIQSPVAQDEDRYQNQFVGIDKKTGNKIYKRLPKSPVLAKDFKELQDYNDIYASTPEEAKRNESAWRAQKTLETKEKGLEFKKSEAQLNREEKILEPLRKEIDESRETALLQKSDLDLQEKVIRDGDTDSLIQYLASKYKWDPALSPSSAMTSTLSKELLTGSLKGIKSRALNQFLEQRIYDMFVTIGRSKPSNLSTIETLRFFNDLANEKIRLFDELKDKVPVKDLSKEIYKKLGDYAENRKEVLSQKLSEIKDEYASGVELRSMKAPPQGTYMTKKRRDALYDMLGSAEEVQKVALKLGYKTPGE